MIDDAYRAKLRAALGEFEKDPDVLRLMMIQGGGFIAALAEAWIHADATNNRKLFAVFGHYYREYEAKLIARRASQR